MANPIAGAEASGKAEAGSEATEINFTTKTAFKSPISNEPVSPIKILAGLKLKIKKPTRLPARDNAITANKVCSVWINKIQKSTMSLSQVILPIHLHHQSD